jgi:sugar phosphate isomerase/epimerase
MPTFSRRSFLSLVAATAAVPAQARKLAVVGVQLYTVRNVLPKRPLETLRAIERIGYREVEATADGLDAIWAALRQTSLRPVSVHVDAELFAGQRAKLPAAIEDAGKRGFQYVVCPYIAPKDRRDMEAVRKLGQTLNQAGEMARAAGLRLCYHNHAFDFQPMGEGRLLDVLLQSTDPKLVQLELDIMWAHVGGADPASVLKQYSGRIPLVHLKDVAPDVQKRYNEMIPPKAFRELGNGAIDLAPVLRAAAAAGVEHYFVEQDATPGDPLDSLRASFAYLKSLDF